MSNNPPNARNCAADLHVAQGKASDREFALGKAGMFF
jgi:hypothetical protein